MKMSNSGSQKKSNKKKFTDGQNDNFVERVGSDGNEPMVCILMEINLPQTFTELSNARCLTMSNRNKRRREFVSREYFASSPTTNINEEKRFGQNTTF